MTVIIKTIIMLTMEL